MSADPFAATGAAAAASRAQAAPTAAAAGTAATATATATDTAAAPAAAPIGIIAALHEEIAGLLARMKPSEPARRIGMREYHAGTIDGRACVIVLARIGKVAAAATAVTLIREFGVSAIVFAGVAGGIGRHVGLGDVVVANQLVQHDMDARPLFGRFEVPLLGLAQFAADTRLTALLAQCAADYLALDLHAQVPARTRDMYGIGVAQLHRGTVGSGDRFVHGPSAAEDLRQTLPDLLCVEMEGAAVAQVCHEYGVPYAVLRTISDRADASAPVDFTGFLRDVASFYATGILGRLLAALPA